MPKILMIRGLPGSGKTTWAFDYLKHHPEAIRVNKDTLRGMLFHEREWTHEQEDLVLALRDYAIDQALTQGYDVVVDDTNFGRHEHRLLEIASDHVAELEVIDFTHIPLEICLERNRAREHPVDEEAIIRMYNAYFKDPIG